MAITPTHKGGDWWDGGQFKERRLHTWTPNTAVVRDSYNSALAKMYLNAMVWNPEGLTGQYSTSIWLKMQSGYGGEAVPLTCVMPI